MSDAATPKPENTQRKAFEFENLDILRGLGEVQQLTGQDAAFVYAESNKGPMHIGALSIYDPSTAPGGKVRFKDILNFIQSRLHKAPTFKRKLQTVPFNVDHPYWVEDRDFDIEFHVRHIALPEPRDWRQLCILAARLHSRPLDMTRPLWEFWVIEGLDNIPNIPKGSYAIVSKIHHAAVDGASAVEIGYATHTMTPEFTHEEPPVDLRRARGLSGFETVGRAQMNAAKRPIRALKLARDMLPGVLNYARGMRDGDHNPLSKKTPRTRFNGTVCGHRVIGAQVFDLKAVKSIRKTSLGTTVNDVMLTVCGGALREYLTAKSDLPQESLIAMAPVSVRTKDEKSSLGNEVSALSVAIGTHIEDPVARMHYVTAITQDSKDAAKALGSRHMSDMQKLAPAALMKSITSAYFRLGLANQIRPTFNTVISNVPGSPVPLYMNGAKMVASYGLGPVLDGVALFHAVTSYVDHIGITFSSDRKMMPDPDFYADCLWRSYEALYEATHDAKAPRLSRRSHTKKIKPNTAKSQKAQQAEEPAEKEAKSPAPTPSDDLKRINGIGPVLEGHLKSAGIKTFVQIAELSAKNIDNIETALDFKGRIEREQWVEQAQDLVAKHSNVTNIADVA